MRDNEHLTKTGKAIFGVWIISALLSIAVSAGTIWAAVHFIRKYW